MISSYQLILILISLIKFTNCSIGDRLPYYVDCLQYCYYFNCSTSTALNEFNLKQSYLLKLMGWNCERECDYNCQFFTIDYLISEKNISNIQFYGKVCKLNFRIVFEFSSN